MASPAADSTDSINNNSPPQRQTQMNNQTSHRRPTPTIITDSTTLSLQQNNTGGVSPMSGLPQTPSNVLEFRPAMLDFKIMFPTMDLDIIEAVLRANNGGVDASIDQLLEMNFDTGIEVSPAESNLETTESTEESAVATDDDLIGLDRSLTGSDGSLGKDVDMYGINLSALTPPKRCHLRKLTEMNKTSSSSSSTHQSSSQDSLGGLTEDIDVFSPVGAEGGVCLETQLQKSPEINQRNSTVRFAENKIIMQPVNAQLQNSIGRWHPPMLGKLPDNFLRLSEPPSNETIETTAAGNSPSPIVEQQDEEKKQLHDDQALAQKLQNDEYNEQLKQNKISRNDSNSTQSRRTLPRPIGLSSPGAILRVTTDTQRSPRSVDPDEEPDSPTSGDYTPVNKDRNSSWKRFSSLPHRLTQSFRMKRKKAVPTTPSPGPTAAPSTANLLEDVDDNLSDFVDVDVTDEQKMTAKPLPQDETKDPNHAPEFKIVQRPAYHPETVVYYNEHADKDIC